MVFTAVEIAICIAKQLGIDLLPGARVPGNGNCFILALLTQMVDRSDVFGLPCSQDVQEWREYLVGITRSSTEARMNVEMSDGEWNRQWDVMLKDGKYEMDVADLLLPALAHTMGLDILIFNANKGMVYIFISIYMKQELHKSQLYYFNFEEKKRFLGGNRFGGANGPILLVQ